MLFQKGMAPVDTASRCDRGVATPCTAVFSLAFQNTALASPDLKYIISYCGLYKFGVHG